MIINLQALDVHTSQPDKTDGKKMWQLVNRTSLDDNSAYKYIMMTHYHQESCVVAKINQQLVGFITGFFVPDRPDTVFVWQIGVDPELRGKGIGLKLLTQLIDQVKDKGVNYIEATITPSNQASQALFKKLATVEKADCRVKSLFTEDLFPTLEQAEEERLFRIGPLRKKI